MKKIVVIGGGAAGMMFSVQYKKKNPQDEVIVFEKTNYVSWAGCPTPYFIADELSFDHVVMGSPESFAKKNIEVNTLHEVTKVDFTKKIVSVKGTKYNGELSYDKLVLAVGAKPRQETFEYDNIFTLTHAESAVKIKKYLNENNPKKAVVIGSGFVGVEMAESFKKLGLDVTIIERMDKIFPSLSDDMRKRIYEELDSHDIKLLLNKVVENIEEKNVVLEDGTKIEYDIILASTGIVPNISFLGDEIETVQGKVKVNKQFETNIPDVYSIGDATMNFLHGKEEELAYAPFGDVANKEGMILARHLSGEKVAWNGVLRSFASSIYDIKFAQTGYSKEMAIANGINAEVIKMTANTKNSGFEDFVPNMVEVVYDKDRQVVIGASVLGLEAVAQFLDQLAIVITLETPIEKFIEIDFAYSPTNASVWNPLLVTYRKVIK